MGMRGGARHSYSVNLLAERRAAPGLQVNKHLSRQENYLAARRERRRGQAREGLEAGRAGRALKASFCPSPVPVLTYQPWGEGAPREGVLSPRGRS